VSISSQFKKGFGLSKCGIMHKHGAEHIHKMLNKIGFMGVARKMPNRKIPNKTPENTEQLG
jgi:hypothetical protein